MIAIRQVREPRRTASWRENRIQVKLIHHAINSFASRKPPICLQRVQIFVAGQRAFGFSFNKKVLAEIGHLFFCVVIIELNKFLERMHPGVGPAVCEISVKIRLQFV